MEWLFLPLFGIVGWVLGVIGFFKSKRALAEIAVLRATLAGAPAPVAAAAPAQREIGPEIAPEIGPEPVLAPEPAVEEAIPELAPEPVTAAAPPPPPKRADLEVLLTQRWGIWLGAMALLLAAVFLVRTAV